MINVTIEQLTKAFKKWNQDVIDHPEIFHDTPDIDSKSQQQAEVLLKYLNEV